ncbi:MAG: DNA alkylation repair protein [Candidatus Aminicenantes bacterium]|nr:DNA alkylation repair protein [Candidatus Aminicenantes bacterium]
MSLNEIRKTLKGFEDKQKARELQRFFKTGPGEYGEGDIFLGIKVPVLRKIAKKYQGISVPEIEKLLHSPIHEERFLSLVLLTQAFVRSNDRAKKKLYEFYLKNTQYINSWDLVDTSAEHIIGAFLRDKSKKPLHSLARSRIPWERRIAIIATFTFIKQNDFNETLQIAKMLLMDKEDLIHKAVGWMLREIGKRDLQTEETFLEEHYTKMPRVMLRYAIEKFPDAKRKMYYKGEI